MSKPLAAVAAVLLSLPLAVGASAEPIPTPAPTPVPAQAQAPAPAPPSAVTAQTGQWIVVGVPKADATAGTLTAFQRVGQQWKAVAGPMKAMVGDVGVGEGADGVHRTPVGTFAFDQAFGREPNPGTKMPYFQATKQDWWDEDADSPTYNTHVRSAASPSAITENLYDSGPVYDYAVNIAVNPQRIPGKVSGIFLHVTDGTPTWGCVAIPREQMKTILNWLDPAQNPRITVGVGDPGLLPAKS